MIEGVFSVRSRQIPLLDGVPDFSWLIAANCFFVQTLEQAILVETTRISRSAPIFVFVVRIFSTN
jgi:hypothetical protein